MLTERDIALFARHAVEHQSDVLTAKTEERKAQCLRQHRNAATAYYTQAQEDVRGSGYRVTQRVRDIIWSTLEQIQAEVLAPEILEASQVSNIAMTTGGEKKYTRIICDGMVKEWTGIGWIDIAGADEVTRKILPVIRGRSLEPRAATPARRRAA